jgi:hypothetical protein
MCMSVYTAEKEMRRGCVCPLFSMQACMQCVCVSVCECACIQVCKKLRRRDSRRRRVQRPLQ